MKTEIGIFGAGCFWGVENIFRDLPGVVNTEVGYCGGTTENPVYEKVKTGQTGHAEVVRVEFDPSKITFKELLGYFFRLHDPTTLNRQGNDLGTQYRSVIFYQNDEQKNIAHQVKDEVNKSGKWSRPLVTQIVQAPVFYSAEEYHQDYLIKNPNGYNCHFLRD